MESEYTNQKFFHCLSSISAFFYWDPFINDVDYTLQVDYIRCTYTGVSNYGSA